MQLGNTNLSYVYDQIKNLPYIKIPLYYIPVFISFWYYPKETFMIGSSYLLFNNLDAESKRRQEDPEYNTRLWENEFSENEDEQESEQKEEEPDGDQQNEEETDGDQQNEEEADGDDLTDQAVIGSELNDDSDNNSELTTTSNEEEYNLVDDDTSVSSKESNSSDGSFWKFFRF